MRVLLMAAVLAAAPMAALAAETPPPAVAAAPAPTPPPETLALARQLVEATGATHDFGARLRAVMDPITQAMSRSLPTAQQPQREAMMTLMQKQIEADAPLFIDAAVQAYARTYTPDELRGLIDFYKTPLGQALVAKQSVLAAEIGRANGALMPTILRDFLAKMCAQTTCPPAVKARIEALTGV